MSLHFRFFSSSVCLVVCVYLRPRYHIFNCLSLSIVLGVHRIVIFPVMNGPYVMPRPGYKEDLGNSTGKTGCFRSALKVFEHILPRNLGTRPCWSSLYLFERYHLAKRFFVLPS